MEVNFPIPDYTHELLLSALKGLNGICQTLAKKVNKSVIITDTFKNIFTSSLHNHKVDCIQFDFQNKILYPNAFPCSLHINGEAKEGLGSPITFEGKLKGYLIILTSIDDPITKQILPLISYTCSLCSIELHNKQQLILVEQKYKETFIFDLLYGNIKQKEDVISRGKLWNWNFTIPHIAIVLTLRDFDYYSKDKMVIEGLLQIVNTMILFDNHMPITMSKTDEVIIIFPIQRQIIINTNEQVKHFLTNVLKQSNILKVRERIAIGIGLMKENPTELYRSYHEAKVALEIGELMDISLPFFSDLGIERILYKHDLQDLKEFYYATLGALKEFDEQNSSDLIHTLEIIVNNQYDLSKASEALFLHRNSLRYRMKKIEDILQIKLDDMNARLNISTALKIKRLRNI